MLQRNLLYTGVTRVSLRPGTRLVREWRGVTHMVLIHADGIEWRGQRYRSLSVVARKITGARWSGPRFFGLRQRGSSTSDDSKTASRDPAAVRAPHPDIWRLWLPPMPSPGS